MKIKSNPPQTILTICTGFLFIYLFTNYQWALFTAIIIACTGIFSKFLSSIIEVVWFKIAEILGYIVPNIILSIIFYFFLFPISLLSKIFRRQTLINLKSSSSSNYIEVNKKFNKKDLKNPF